MKTSDFNLDLPMDLIAQEPLSERSSSRMMVFDRVSGSLEHRHVHDLPEFLRTGDLLVVNDTRVIPARVFGKRVDTGGRVELLLVEERRDVSGGAPNHAVWEALYRAAGKPHVGLKLLLAGDKIEGEIVEFAGMGRVVLKMSAGNASVEDVLNQEGLPPVPPYIKRAKGKSSQSEADRSRYQTVYARESGAIAAPTAGLHFTPELLAGVERTGVRRAAVTLHVGLGTFKPVKSENVEDHKMEEERYCISSEAADAIMQTKKAGGRIVAVGTTTVRSLETAFAQHGCVCACKGRSSLFIYPPYNFGVVDCMLTNFHLPMSTLLMMISAFAGKETIMRAYQEAIENRYRFYSYGDCMLIL